MKTNLLLAGAMLLSAFIPCPAPAAEGSSDAAAVRKIFTAHGDAVVWVSAVCNVRISTEGGKDGALNIPEREEKMETLATVISADGLLVTALSTIDPSRVLNGRELNTRGGRIKVTDVNVDYKEIKIIMPDGTEVPAEVVFKDIDLDLGFLKAKADAKETKTVTFKPIDLKNSGPTDVGESVAFLGRADEVLGRQPSVTRSQVISIIKKPREFIRVPPCWPSGRTVVHTRSSC